MLVIRRHDPQGRHAPLLHQRREQRIRRRGRGRRRILRIHRQHDQPIDARRDHFVARPRPTADCRPACRSAPARRAELVAAARSAAASSAAGASRCRIPDALILGGGLRGPARQDEQVEDEPPLQARHLDDARIAEELAQIGPQRLGSGGVGSAELDEQNAGAHSGVEFAGQESKAQAVAAAAMYRTPDS